MPMVRAHATDFDTWRREARALLRAGAPPVDVIWEDVTQPTLFGTAIPRTPSPEDVRHSPAPHFSAAFALRHSPSPAPSAPTVPAHFLEQAHLAADHADRSKYAVLYNLLWKLTHGAPSVLADPLDPDTRRLTAMLRDVREEEHRMHAFVRFRKCETSAPGATTPNEHWIAWYAPTHGVLRRVAPFFARRYPTMHWSLFTPDASAHWDGHELTFGEGAPRDRAPAENELDDLFLTYYASVFNPARTNVQATFRHLPHRAKAQLPERKILRSLIRDGGRRVEQMTASPSSASTNLIPAARPDGALPSLSDLRLAASRCDACSIGHRATQTVFGEGPENARLMLVGEQPGEEEDRAGRPFVGPAGRLLDAMLERVGLPRAQLYVTNAVKHFKWTESEPRGKRRLHAKPNRDEIGACRGWLLAEVETVKPAMILCLGATAAQSFCGPQFRVQRDRGKPTPTPWAPWWMATFHPSALLRAADESSRRAMEAQFLDDLQRTRDHWQSLAA